MKLDINVGDKFNKLTVVKEVDKKILPSGQVNRVFLCECDCGNLKEIRLVHLKRGATKSCGCVNNVQPTKELSYIRKIWRAIKYRTSENYSESHLYYDKGIFVCDDWLNNYESFKNWALVNGLKKGLTIDRIDGDKGYNPDNCRVVSQKVNTNNRHNTMYVVYKGKKYAFTELLDIKYARHKDSKIRARIKRGWSIEDAFDKK